VTAYFISGLGADQSIFQNLTLPEDVAVKYIQWIEPGSNERLDNYCRRLCLQIDPAEEFILVGLSFGGIVAIEISKIIPARYIIIISSISSKHELPFRYRIANYFRLHKITPGTFLKWHNRVTDWLFDAQSKQEKLLLGRFMKTVSINYLRWSMDKVLNWDHIERPDHLLHIHGTRDRILDCANTKADIKIAGGGHFMVFNRSAEVSKLISEKLKALRQ
jgi:surfactin synthase thioesterase subunit